MDLKNFILQSVFDAPSIVPLKEAKDLEKKGHGNGQKGLLIFCVQEEDEKLLL